MDPHTLRTSGEWRVERESTEWDDEVRSHRVLRKGTDDWVSRNGGSLGRGHGRSGVVTAGVYEDVQAQHRSVTPRSNRTCVVHEVRSETHLVTWRPGLEYGPRDGGPLPVDVQRAEKETPLEPTVSEDDEQLVQGGDGCPRVEGRPCPFVSSLLPRDFEVGGFTVTRTVTPVHSVSVWGSRGEWARSPERLWKFGVFVPEQQVKTF